MPPRTVKRGAAAAGPKRGVRATRGTPKAAQNQQQPEAAEEAVKHEEKPVVEEEIKVEEKPVVEEKSVVEEKPVVEEKSIDMNKLAPETVEEERPVTNGSAAVKSKFFIFYFLFFWSSSWGFRIYGSRSVSVL